MKSIRLGRRTVLRGALAGGCVALGLPALEAMTTSRGLFYGSAHGALEKPPVRLLTVFFRNGVLMDRWTPGTAGTDYEMPACLTPLEALRDDLNIITGLFNAGGMSGPGGDHVRGTGSFATGMPISYTGAGGPSFEQIAAQKLGSGTKLPSLVVAPEGHPGGGESDGASDACNHLSWSDKNTPVPPEIDPAALFDKLFDGGMAADSLAVLRAQQKSVLDSVGRDIARLNARLGVSDRKRLDAHLTALRELEQRAADSRSCEAPVRPEPDSARGPMGLYASESKVKLMMDLTVQALACDISRFGSFSLALDVAPRVERLFGDRRDHHSISHDNSSTARPVIEEYSRYQVELFAYFLERMKSVSEGEGTLLDNCAVYFANQIAHGDVHTHDNLPVILAGKAGGRITTGRHVHLLPGDPLPGRRDGTKNTGRSVNDLFLALLHMAGVDDATRFGLDGETPLDLG